MNTVTITLRNTGSVPVDASVIDFSDPDRFSAGTAPGIIAPGATAPLDVNFHPAAEPGTHTAFLIIRAGNIKIPLTAETLAGPEIIHYTEPEP